MRRLALILFCLEATTALAHPSTGIVIAANGDVFYSDLAQVLRVTPRGQRSVAVPNVHAHELVLEDGAVVGEDVAWLGGDRYRHRVFKRTPDGRVTNVVPWTNGFFLTEGLRRDAAGARYWIDCTPARRCTIRKRDRAGRVSNLVSSGPMNWMLVAPAGEVYYIDGVELRRVRAGRVERVARIGEMLMGMTFDRAGNVYVAAFKDRAVVRVSPSGATRVVARSAAPWGPTGVAIAPNGDLWILEWAETRARVRRATP
ncbi:MAG TPA: hypothetical protein VM733_06670 [Thermoanaerobaculia bacterium]|nr:hypothetical protein [Thermoanaerobaculia bacterium]